MCFILHIACDEFERPKIRMNLRQIQKPNCVYRLMVEWNMEYDVDVLQSIESFTIVVHSETDHFTIKTDDVIAHNTVSYIYEVYKSLMYLLPFYIEYPCQTSLSSNKRLCISM